MHNIVAEEGKRVYCGGSSELRWVTGMQKSRAYILDRIAKKCTRYRIQKGKCYLQQVLFTQMIDFGVANVQMYPKTESQWSCSKSNRHVKLAFFSRGRDAYSGYSSGYLKAATMSDVTCRRR
jgi:hypothetical protein